MDVIIVPPRSVQDSRSQVKTKRSRRMDSSFATATAVIVGDMMPQID